MVRSKGEYMFYCYCYTEELKEFRKNLNVIQLGGIWKDVKVTEEEIVSTRKELLKKLDRKW
jgi:hypothetical protein